MKNCTVYLVKEENTAQRKNSNFINYSKKKKKSFNITFSLKGTHSEMSYYAYGTDTVVEKFSDFIQAKYILFILDNHLRVYCQCM